MGDDETTDQARQRELEPAIEAALSERERTGYPRPEKQSVRGEAGTGRARPLEFDRNGFPVAQRNPAS